MVVVYAAPPESFLCAFLFFAPRVLFKCRGSIIPKLLPQLIVTVGLSVLALYWNPLTEMLPSDSSPQDAYVVIGFLVCFLTFFKTQAAYAEFLQAMDFVEDLLHNSRRLGILACTILDWEAHEDVRPLALRILRLVVLQYFIITEYLSRTGPNHTNRDSVKDRLREDIRHITATEEFQLLYPEEPPDMPGSRSQYKTANPLQVTMWIQMLFSIAQKKGAILTAPALNVCVDANMHLYKAFCGLNRIDKTQFPFPYAQLVKLLNIFWVFTYPFVLEPTCRQLTPFAMTLVAIGFFGCEEVAEILSSPFGTDENDIDLKYYGKWLIRDLDVVWKSRDAQTEWLSSGLDRSHADFSDMLENLGYNRKPSGNFFRTFRRTTSGGRIRTGSGSSETGRTRADPQVLPMQGTMAARTHPKGSVHSIREDHYCKQDYCREDMLTGPEVPIWERSETADALESRRTRTLDAFDALPGASELNSPRLID